MNNKLDVLKSVELLVQEVESTHRYSMSRIYGLWNEVFGKNEHAQSCASCLMRKVKELKSWMEGEKKLQETDFEPVETENQSQETEDKQQKEEKEVQEKPVKKRGRKKKEA